MTTRIAIIGVGPSGLAALRAFQSLANKGENIPEIVCFEKQSTWGGMWNYSWRTGMDENGENVHNSMYRYLWSNGPKECLEFSDYSFEEHFGKAIASYPPREVLHDYIQGRILKDGITHKIRLSTAVRNVQFNDGIFSITAEDYKNKNTYTEDFDYCIVASGHFSVPNAPHYPGFSSFNGRILHAHDFRDALEFRDKDILILGNSYSAEDIGSQCYKYGAKSITTCYRHAPMGYDWPSNWQEKELLIKVDGKTAHFKDGSTKEVDAIILCTGYIHHFPFMSEELKLRTANILYPLNLYKGVIWENNNQLIYLGMQDQWYTFNMFDAQAWYARDVILGKIKLPDLETMQKHTQEWHEKEQQLESNKAMIYFQGDYVQMLIDETDYPNIDTEGVNKTFVAWKDDKQDSIMGYRDKSYPSLITGTPSPAHHTPWLEALDDSMKDYLKER